MAHGLLRLFGRYSDQEGPAASNCTWNGATKGSGEIVLGALMLLLALMIGVI